MRPLLPLTLLILAGCETVPPAQPPASAPSPAPKSQAPPEPAADLPTGLHVVLLGTGTPIPDPRRAGPSTAIVVNGHAYVVDAGDGVLLRADAAHRRGKSALNVTSLDRVFLTHLHSDHTTGLPALMRGAAVVGRQLPLQVYGPSGTAAMLEHLEAAYSVDHAMRMQVGGSPEGYTVHAHEIAPGPVYADDHVRVRAIGVAHGLFRDALGYRFDAAGRSAVVSGDTAPSDAIATACDGCDVLVHEVYCASGLRRLEPGVQSYHRLFHTSSEELAALATRARPKLLVLTHLLSFGCSDETLLREVREGYAGPVALGEDLVAY